VHYLLEELWDQQSVRDSTFSQCKVLILENLDKFTPYHVVRLVDKKMHVFDVRDNSKKMITLPRICKDERNMAWVTVAKDVVMVLGVVAKKTKVKGFFSKVKNAFTSTPNNGCDYVNVVTGQITPKANMVGTVREQGPVYYKRQVWSFGGDNTQ